MPLIIIEERVECPIAERCPDAKRDCFTGRTDHLECQYYEDKTHHSYQIKTKVMERF